MRTGMRTGKVLGFYGSWSSGLAYLEVKERKGIKRIPCDNGPTVRALASMFPSVIGPGHTVNVAAIRGKRIRYATDEFGILAVIAPA